MFNTTRVASKLAMLLMLLPAHGRGQEFDPFGGVTTTDHVPTDPTAPENQDDGATRTAAAPPPPGAPPRAPVVSTSVRGLGPTIGRVQFTNDDLSMVFQVVSDASGWSIFPGEKVAGKITLYAADITAGDLLDRAVTLAGFMYVKQGNIISVLTYEDYMMHYGVVKRTLALTHRDAQEMANVLSQFVTPRGKLIPDPGTRTLVVYEVPANLSMLEDIARTLDLPTDHKVVRIVHLTYADAEELAAHLEEIFEPKEQPRTEGGERSDRGLAPFSTTQPIVVSTNLMLSAEGRVAVHSVPRTNHLILRGYAPDLARVEELVKELDVPDEQVTRHYQIVHLLASDVLASLEEALGLYGDTYGSGMQPRGTQRQHTTPRSGRGGNSLQASQRVRLSALIESNAIVVTAPPVVHREVADFIELCDTPPVEIAGGIRHYRLENATAAEVAQILRELIEQEARDEEGAFRVGTEPGVRITGPSAHAPPPPQPSPAGPGPGGDTMIEVAGERRTEKPRITFSEATNTVIIQATVSEHAQFAQVIAELDRQQPQVLIEAIIVELRGTDDIDVGVEFESFQEPGDSAGHLLFTSFGLSTIDPATGQRNVSALPGGTAVITRASEIPVILHALQSTGKTRIRAAPRLLVNDNTMGRVLSIAEEPYSQLNASDTVATTSFGGFVQAGTQLLVTPRVSNADYLRLEYEITLNSFRGGTTDPSLPPARDTSTIASQATVPDGGTLIVAGLSYESNRDNEDRLPLIGDLPLVGPLFRRTMSTENNTRLYVFIRPTILRDSLFRELKAISASELLEAGEPDDAPTNPLLELDIENG